VNRNVLSNQIRQLEQTMGQELFLRDQRNYLRTTLTPAGQELAQEVREALAPGMDPVLVGGAEVSLDDGDDLMFASKYIAGSTTPASTVSPARARSISVSTMSG
jgi:hypothetical protein